MAHHSPYQKGVKNAYNLAIFAVADGHNGSAAAQHVQEMLCSEIKRHLPVSPPPLVPGTDGGHTLSWLPSSLMPMLSGKLHSEAVTMH